MLIVTVTLLGAMATDTAIARPSRSRVWVERAWEIRYVLFVADAYSIKYAATSARAANRAPEKPGRQKVYLSAEEMFEATNTFLAPKFDSIATVVIPFDRSGRATTLKNHTATVGKISMLGSIVLTENGDSKKRPYRLADWGQGIPGDTTFSPAVCADFDDSRYEDGWRGAAVGSFGCREWTAQLYDRDRPYIDVTSYEPRRSYIGQFVGWSRFQDPPKPVIGLHGKTWLCLHECPAGEQPGIIADIKAWTTKHGYPMPKRPPRQPMYPNSLYRDDLGEFGD
jgi:hypothetical protein